MNIRGTINSSDEVRNALRSLRIPARFRATIIPENDSYRGMLEKVKHRVSWCKADKELIKEMLLKRGIKEGWKKLGEEDVKSLGYSSIEELSSAIAEDKVDFGKLKGIKPFFALSPPKGGFKRSIRRLYGQGGILGENPELPEILRRMI